MTCSLVSEIQVFFCGRPSWNSLTLLLYSIFAAISTVPLKVSNITNCPHTMNRSKFTAASFGFSATARFLVTAVFILLATELLFCCTFAVTMCVCLAETNKLTYLLFCSWLNLTDLSKRPSVSGHLPPRRVKTASRRTPDRIFPASSSWIMAKFHYADFTVTSSTNPWRPL